MRKIKANGEVKANLENFILGTEIDLKRQYFIGQTWKIYLVGSR